MACIALMQRATHGLIAISSFKQGAIACELASELMDHTLLQLVIFLCPKIVSFERICDKGFFPFEELQPYVIMLHQSTLHPE